MPIDDFSPHMRYWPDKTESKFYLPGHLYDRFKPYLKLLKTAHPESVESPPVTPNGFPTGYYFGPYDNKALDEIISTKFKVPPSTEPFPGDDMSTPSKLGRHQEFADIPVNYGRGRPAKYDFKSLKKIGDSFMVLEGKLGHIQSAARKYLLRYQLEVDHKIECIRTGPGVLVVMTACADDSVAEHVEQTFAD
jgi:hypothetical protein